MYERERGVRVVLLRNMTIYLLTMMIKMTRPMTPMIIIIYTQVRTITIIILKKIINIKANAPSDFVAKTFFLTFRPAVQIVRHLAEVHLENKITKI